MITAHLWADKISLVSQILFGFSSDWIPLKHSSGRAENTKEEDEKRNIEEVVRGSCRLGRSLLARGGCWQLPVQPRVVLPVVVALGHPAHPHPVTQRLLPSFAVVARLLQEDLLGGEALVEPPGVHLHHVA